jgi:hypothetical protein
MPGYVVPGLLMRVKRLPGAVRNFTSAIDAVLARYLSVHYSYSVFWRGHAAGS